MSGRTALLVFAAATLLVARSVSAQRAASTPSVPNDFRLLFTGDVLMSRLVKVEIDQRRTSPWGDRKSDLQANSATGFSDLFHSASLVGGNFEGALGDPAKCPTENKLCFASPGSFAEMMKKA